MKHQRILWSVTVGMATFALSATEYPLAFKSLKVDEAFTFGGAPGLSGSLTHLRPKGLKNEPKAASSNPIYGQFVAAPDTNGLLFRLDESKGKGKGYDALLIDFNRNGDLTDDALAPAAPAQKKTTTTSTESRRFGPISLPPNQRLGDWRPQYYAEMTLYNRNLSLLSATRSTFLGYLRLRPGWYLEARADFGTDRHKVAVLDANCNFRLGDRPATRVLSGTNWYFTGGDMMLLDANNSGAYETSATSTESCLFSSLLYDGPTPYKLALAADSKSIRIEPCPAPLAEVSLQPMGEQVQNITFAWEQTKDQWQMVRAGAARGKVLAPPGNYRLYGCDLFTGGSGGQTVFAKGYKRTMQPALTFQPGAHNVLQCGAPLQVNVTASNTRSASTAAGSGLAARVSSLVRTANSQDTVRINAVVSGRGGETYSSYSMGLAGDRPPKPKFTILAMNGKEVASGNLEFG